MKKVTSKKQDFFFDTDVDASFIKTKCISVMAFGIIKVMISYQLVNWEYSYWVFTEKSLATSAAIK